MDQILQVRIGGQVVSRVTLAELRAEIQAGSIGQFHEVSLDGKSWFDARQFAFETTNPPAAPAATSFENPGADFPHSAPDSAADHASGSPQSRQAATPAPQPVEHTSTPAQSPGAQSQRLPTSVDLAVPNVDHIVHEGRPGHEQQPAPSSPPGTVHPQSASPAHRPSYPKEITWMAIIRSQECGPFGSDQLRQMASYGKIGLGDLVWCEGYPDWVPVEQQFPDFFPHAPSRRARRVPREQQSYSLLAVASLVAALIWGGGFFSAVSVILGILGLIDVIGGAGYRKGSLFAVLGLILGIGGIVGSLFFWTALIG